MAAGRTGGRQQVGRVFASDTREAILEDAVQLGGKFQQAGRIEMDLVHVREGLDRVREDGSVGLRRDRGQVHARSLQPADRFSVVHQAPVGLGGAAFDNQDHSSIPFFFQ